jgi:hypothetical protein
MELLDNKLVNCTPLDTTRDSIGHLILHDADKFVPQLVQKMVQLKKNAQL